MAASMCAMGGAMRVAALLHRASEARWARAMGASVSEWDRENSPVVPADEYRQSNFEWTIKSPTICSSRRSAAERWLELQRTRHCDRPFLPWRKNMKNERKRCGPISSRESGMRLALAIGEIQP